MPLGGARSGCHGFHAADQLSYAPKAGTSEADCSIICLVLVMVGAGASSLRVERTLVLGPIHFQPSEFVKLALILFFAYNMSEH